MRRILTFLLCGMLLSGSAAAQGLLHRAVPDLGFGHLERNAIRFPAGKSEDFSLFLRKLDTLMLSDRGNVRILHVGGSHVQGGMWTDQLRRNLLSLRYGMDGGRGLVFPFAAAGTNTPSGYRSTATGSWTSTRCLHPEEVLGVTGMAVSTADTSATVTISLAADDAKPWDIRYMVRSVEVLGYGDLEPVLLMGRDTVRGRAQGEGWHFDLPHYTDYVSLGFRGFPGRFTLTGLYLDRPSAGLTVSEAGVNGAATSSWLQCDDFERDLRLVAPDLVIFSVGINDIQGKSFDKDRFERNYGNLVKMVHRVNPHCAILFTTNNDSWKNRTPNRFGIDSREAFTDLARRHGAGLWDLFDIMGGLGSMDSWVQAGLARPDHVHFTREGYTLLGNLLFNALMDCYAP